MTKRDYLLGKLEAMAKQNEKFQTECMTTLRDIHETFSNHSKEDAEKFGEIHTVIAEAKGRVKGAVAVVSVVAATVSFLVGLFGNYIARWLGL